MLSKASDLTMAARTPLILILRLALVWNLGTLQIPLYFLAIPRNKPGLEMETFITVSMLLETQFSLPQTTLEMATVEKLLQIPEDSVPCKIRAKRGCATHPRSIAERVSKTKSTF
ncbi:TRANSCRIPTION FACTOR BHLH83-RELATED [Salix purpurea]|uniref:TRANSCRIPTION FACTOR BHLH83-RELATED n=1 Tax=Salix purpurea TaxID=77065 RepID=A0A9Q0SKN2_SALPP|nr:TRANSCRIPTION FACTOR BHLH83-RELATED [Salix purpurea]